MKFQSPQPEANLLPVIHGYRLLLAAVLGIVVVCSDENLVKGSEKAPFVPTLILVDDSIVSAPALTIADGRISGDGVPAGLTVDDLRRIVTHDEDDYLTSETNFD